MQGFMVETCDQVLIIFVFFVFCLYRCVIQGP